MSEICNCLSEFRQKLVVLLEKMQFPAPPTGTLLIHDVADGHDRKISPLFCCNMAEQLPRSRCKYTPGIRLMGQKILTISVMKF